MNIKSYTDLEQSKKLAKILLIESADMHYCYDYVFDELESVPTITEEDDHFVLFPKDVPCWSLAALLNVLPSIEGFRPIIDLDINLIRYEGSYRDELCFSGNNLIDACVTMIENLHELKIL